MTESAPQDPLDHPLARLVAGEAPGAVLAIAPPDHPGLVAAQAAAPGAEWTLLPPGSQVADLPQTRFDLALLLHAVEPLESTAGEQLIGRVRDLLAPRLILAVAAGTRSANALRGLGLVHAGDSDDGAVALWTWDIATYKLTPDWLNSRFWANPELFDVYWW
ncbi:hypothetical protein SAMN05660831_02119 [Thiohalospira halophila DSM 15071]|uniref:Uncharacterized protein n=1 Tax=Thiohalospira halophila DSM 15071 TaxID=1123397 RepID=A0A1I1UDR0_9GAMM|nr:DUF6231 family protein [Thiohalospira halophila]SFD68889.1 hypothetical protein SAMN05660831_02119 [Thiohalospira halophila DSM 15071]